jgi:ankyrin repeat protein
VNVHDKDHNTPLCTAATFGHIDAVRVLLDHHADVKCRDTEGRTLLHTALNEDLSKESTVYNSLCFICLT